MQTICGLFGYSRQAYYKSLRVNARNCVEESIVLDMIHVYREKMPRIGGYKLHDMINKSGYRISRADIFSIMRNNRLLVRRKGRFTVTTNSNHWMKKYPNLIKDFIPYKPNQLWVSDITYIPVVGSYAYLSLITDAYSHQIIGHSLYRNLEAEGPLRALRMALDTVPRHKREGLIHHSDRGSQYCCHEYVKLLKSNDIQISMTDNGDPYENALAERVNGILKDEWLNLENFKTFQQAEDRVSQVIDIYNTMRPHASCDMMTPQEASTMEGVLKKRWKKKKYPPKKLNSQLSP